MKPCAECPWTKRGFISSTVKAAAKRGEWFCCHANMGTCFGAENYAKRANTPQTVDLMQALKDSLRACDEAISPPLLFEVGPIAPPTTLTVFCSWCEEIVEADVRAVVGERAFCQCKCGKFIEDTLVSPTGEAL